MPNWLSKWLRPNRTLLDPIQPHMTFGQTSVARTVRRTGLFLKKQLWVWPIFAVILLSIAGYAVSTSINRTIKNSLQSELSTLLNVERAMLRRPTAIKMLQADNLNEAAIGRFEREVQITSKLNHPNSIAIYDFGRTPEGVFYYAMEFLDGIDLQTLVSSYGPQTEGRVVHILKQVCGSLYEAHSMGLVHRDIKPANIMLNRRGGESDVVNVLDFGLVKALDDREQSQKTGGLSGTPLYMSPESIQTPDTVDGRSDLYALGAVGYFLLTGQTVFQARTLSELCQLHITGVPELPSQRLGRPISSGLEDALMACLEKNRAKRPQTARALAKMLETIGITDSWTSDEAEAWWGRHERKVSKSLPSAVQPSDNPPTSDPPTSSSGFDQTIGER